MDEDLKSKVSAYRKLLHSLRVISLHTNLSYRIANADGYNKLITTWEKEKAPLLALSTIINNENWKCDTFEDNIDPKLWHWFSPLWDYKNLSDTEKKSRMLLEGKIKDSIWKTRHSLGNPLHDSLTQTLPFVRVFSRLQTIRLLKAIKDIKEGDIIENPTGLNRGLRKLPELECFNINENDLMVVGVVWILEKLKDVNADIFELNREEYFRTRLENYINYGNKIKSQINYNYTIDFKDLSNLLVMVGMHQTLTTSKLKDNISYIYYLLQKLNEIFINNRLLLQDIHSSGWQSLLDFVLFIYDDNTRLLLNELLRAKDIYLEDQNPMIFRRLSGRIERNNIVYARPIIEEPAKEIIDWQFLVKKEISEIKLDEILDRPVICECPGGNIKFEQHFREFISKTRISKSDLERIEYERLQSNLIKLKEDDVTERYKLLCESVRRIVLADKAIYFEYNGLQNILEPQAVTRSQMLSYDYEEESKERANVLSTLKKIFGSINSISNTDRNDSSAYRSLDNLKLISRFEGNDFNPFATKVINKVKTLSRELPTFFKEDEDILSIPIIVFGRIIGLFHLSTVLPFQFKLEDRFTLLRYLQIFEKDIFEANSAVFLKKIHLKLEKAIKDEISEDEFLFKIGEDLGRLIGANGISIWWCPIPEDKEIQIKCIVGDKLRLTLGKGTFADLLEDHFFRNLLDNSVSVFHDEKDFQGIGSAIKQSGLINCFQSAMRDESGRLLGVIMVHDSRKIPQSRTFIMEFEYLTKEIQQVLINYYEHKGKIETIRLYYGHDINSYITRIKEVTQRLKKIKQHLNIEYYKRNNFEKSLEDIEENCNLAHKIFVFMTSGKFRQLNHSIQKDNI